MDENLLKYHLKSALYIIKKQKHTEKSIVEIDAENIHNNSFANHLLKEESEQVKVLYIIGLLLIADSTKNLNLQNVQFKHIKRIIASYDTAVDIDNYILAKLKATNDTFEDFHHIIKGDIAKSFVVDAFILSMLSKEQACYDITYALISLISIEKDVLKMLAEIAKHIVEENLFAFLDVGQHNVKINLNRYIFYFEKYKDFYIASSVEKGINHTGNVIFNGLNFYNNIKTEAIYPGYSNDSIFLSDGFNAKENIFYACNFTSTWALKVPGFEPKENKKFVLLNNTTDRIKLQLYFYRDHKWIELPKNTIVEFNGCSSEGVKTYELQ